jgi:hypothetical protein
VRKAVRDIQECHRRHFQYLPQLKDINDNKIKRMLANGEAAPLRGKLITFSLLLKQKTEHDISYEADDLDFQRLTGLIAELNSYV